MNLKMFALFVSWIIAFAYCLVVSAYGRFACCAGGMERGWARGVTPRLPSFFGAPILIMGGVVSEKYMTLIYAAMILAGCMMFIGYMVDAKAK